MKSISMGFYPDGEPISLPRLSLYSLPTKPDDPPTGMPTPPGRTLASVPFQWEEAPGKPRPTAAQSKPKSARCLDLPPRLLNSKEAAKVANIPSPTTVLDGPDVSRSLSFGSGKSLENLGSNGKKYNNKGRLFGSNRWGSFRRNKNKEGSVDRSFEFSSSAVDGGDGAATKVKITRFRRRSSSLSFSSTRSHLLTGIYENLKQVVPWRRRQEN